MTRITNVLADYSVSLDIIPAVTGASYFNIFQGANRRVLTRNLADGTIGAQIIGNVAPQVGWAEFGGSTGYLQTDKYDAPEITVASVCWCPDVDLSGILRPIYLGTYTSFGTNLQRQSDTQDGIVTSFDIGATQNRVAALNSAVESWAFIVGRVYADAPPTLKNMTLGTSAIGSTPNPGAPRKVALDPFRVGFGYAGTGGAHRQMLAGIWPRALTDDELDVLYSQAKSIAGGVGVTV